jgi:hypothetical protein
MWFSVSKMVLIFRSRSYSSSWSGLCPSLMAWSLSLLSLVVIAGCPNTLLTNWDCVCVWAQVQKPNRCVWNIFRKAYVGLLLHPGFAVKNSGHLYPTPPLLWSIIFVIATARGILPWSICYKDSFVFLCTHKSDTLSNDQLTWWEQNRSKPMM